MKSRKTRLALFASAVAAVLIVIFAAYRSGQISSSPLSASGVPDDSSGTASIGSRGLSDRSKTTVAAEGGTSRPNGFSTAALPPATKPVAEVVALLRDDALGGAAKPACRIAADLQRCYGANQTLSAAAAITRSGSNAPQAPQLANSLLKSYEQTSAMCEGVTDAMIREAYRFQKIAADSGNRNYQKWLATKPALEPQDFLSNLEAWRDYRSRAKAYFDQALIDKHADDLALLLLVYAPGDSAIPRPPFRVDDRLTFVSLYEIAKRNNIPMPPQIDEAATFARAGMTQDELLAAAQRAAELDGNWARTSASGSPYESLLTPDASAICK